MSLFYVSDYGFNDRLAQSVARGLTKTDVEVHMVDLNLADTQEIVEAVGRAAAIVVTMPPSAGRAHDMLGTVLASVKPKQKLMLAESYGGNDEPVDPLAASFAAAGLELALPALRVKDTPSEATYQARVFYVMSSNAFHPRFLPRDAHGTIPDVSVRAPIAEPALIWTRTAPRLSPANRSTRRAAPTSGSCSRRRSRSTRSRTPCARRWPRRSAACPAACTS